MARILIATSNAGKLRDFAGVAAAHGVEVAGIPDFASLPQVIEDGETFEANARKKAEGYSRHAAGQLVVADDSGLEVDALAGAPGVHSARYAAAEGEIGNASDERNNAKLLRELADLPVEKRTARFVCVIAVAQDGKLLQEFRGEAEGYILDAPRGSKGFGYDPLFFSPEAGKTFAELGAEEKAKYSHRGRAFEKFLKAEKQPKGADPSKRLPDLQNLLLLVWLVLLLPCLLMIPVSGMAFDSGRVLSPSIFVGALWTYPIAVAVAAIGKGHKPLLMLAPCINAVALFVGELLSLLGQ